MPRRGGGNTMQERTERQRAGIPDCYTAVDVETTGLNPRTDRIIKIGAVRVKNGRETERFSTLINPECRLDARITKLTGIGEEMLAGAPVIGEIIGRFVDFCGDDPLLGHQIRFDYSFLKRAAVNRGIPFEKEGLDTLRLCRRFMPPDCRKNLAEACRYFGICPDQSHRALADAVSAHLLYEELAGRFFSCPEAFAQTPLICRIRREQPASKKQKEVLQDLVKYHKISLTVQVDSLSRNEASRLTDRIISQYGRMIKR